MLALAARPASLSMLCASCSFSGESQGVSIEGGAGSSASAGLSSSAAPASGAVKQGTTSSDQKVGALDFGVYDLITIRSTPWPISIWSIA